MRQGEEEAGSNRSCEFTVLEEAVESRRPTEENIRDDSRYIQSSVRVSLGGTFL